MSLHFAPFTLDTADRELRRGSDVIPLTPKSFAVLRYMVENPGRLISKQELLDAVWPNTFVQEAVLKVCVLEIRKALGEDSKNPHFIQTLHRRGYRFIGTQGQQPGAVAANEASLIGRDAEIASLSRAFEAAESGRRQLVFIAGDAGMGKTTLIRSFVEMHASRAMVLAGTCVDHLGEREPYYPVFEAFARAGTQKPGGAWKEHLLQHAPTWLAQMPSLLDAGEAESIRRAAFGATRERMLREMCEVLERLAADSPVLLILEDLHWSDVPTLDLVARVAHGASAARLMIVGSYRPVDLILSEHPFRGLRQNLRGRGLCSEILMESLTKQHVAALVAHRLPGHELDDATVAHLHEHTEGNPLFLTNVLEDAIANGWIAERDGVWRLTAPHFDLGIPDSLRHTIERQIERLPAAEQEALEAASVAGVEFPSYVLGSADSSCESLAERMLFVREGGLFENGEVVTPVLAFTHSLYREVLYLRLSATKRMRLHREVGVKLEELYQGRLQDVANELAMHFEQARDHRRAIRFLKMAALRAMGRRVPASAVSLLQRALHAAARLPAGEREAAETELFEQIGLVYRVMGQFERAAEFFERLAARAMEDLGLLKAHMWLASVLSWVSRERCLQSVAVLAEVAERQPEGLVRANAKGQVAYWNLLYRGWNANDAAQSAAALAAAKTAGDSDLTALHGGRHSFFLSMQSRYREAADVAADSVRLAMETENSQDYSIALFFHAWSLLHAADWTALGVLLADAQATASKNGHELWLTLFRLMEAWAWVHRGRAREGCGIARECLAVTRANAHTYGLQMSLVVLGLALEKLGEYEEAEGLFGEVREWHSRERVLMDWIWVLPLQCGLVDVKLGMGCAEEAVGEARELLRAAYATDEVTYKALAHDALARALADPEEAAKACALIEGVEAPLAAARVLATASELGLVRAARVSPV